MIDIIVVNFNTPIYMEALIPSIYKFTPKPFRLIIIDNGSFKDSIDLFNKTKEEFGHELICLDRNYGVAHARNIGMRMGIRYGEYGTDVIALDSDTLITGIWLEPMLEMAKDRVGIVEAKVKIHDGTFRYAGICATLLRRVMLDDVGVMDANFFSGEDEDYRVRVHTAGWEFAFCKDTNITHYCGGTAQGVLNDFAKGNQMVKSGEKQFWAKYTKEYMSLHHFPTVKQRNEASF